MDNNNQAQLSPQAEKKGMFERMSFFQKLLLGAGILILLLLTVAILFGGIKSFYQFFFYLIVFVGVLVCAYIVIQASSMFFAPRYYSPRNDLRTKLRQMATDYNPDNLGDLWFVGNVGKRRVNAGKIIGCLGLPYYTGEVCKDKEGKIIYTEIKDFEGKKIPTYKNVKVSEDGDTLFITKKGWFIFAKEHLIRAHHSLHSTLNGDVDLYDINPCPFGYYEYPYQQMQKNITQIMVQNNIETVIMTHEHLLDMISTGVDSAVYFNPMMRFAMKQNAEMPNEGQ